MKRSQFIFDELANVLRQHLGKSWFKIRIEILKKGKSFNCKIGKLYLNTVYSW